MGKHFFWILTLAVLLAAASSVSLNGESRASNAFGSARTAVTIYGKYCSSCHGRDGKAQTQKAKLNHARNIADSKWQDEVSDERMYNSIMNGRNVRGNMPAFSKKITDQEADSLVSYIRGLRK